jgi:hypothetical protein
MAGVAKKSGGHNRLSLEEHQLRDTYRADRHAHLIPTPPVLPVARADRRRVLKGLSAGPRRIAVALLDSHGPWNAASLETLRAYALSCERLEQLQAVASADDHGRPVHREIRANLALLKALELER